MFFANKLYYLRKKENLSQEAFAEIFKVSRQAVQKWENGVSVPETSTLIAISKHFGISLDNLLLDRDERMSEELKAGVKLNTCCEDMPGYVFYGSAIRTEYEQSFDEGLDIEQYKELFETVAKLPNNDIKKDLGGVIQKIVLNAPYREDYRYIEPSNIGEIRNLRKSFDLPKKDISDLKEKIYGAWMGRICGCMLGKTVEGIRNDELVRFLKQTDNFPMKRYIRKSDLNKVDLSKFNYDFPSRKYADEIDCMPVDDDTNYTVLAQLIFENYGPNFTSENVAETWLRYQSHEAYFTAEKVAFCNFIKGYRPPQSAIHENPYREWIGAQIRADYWGYINIGNPEKAAEVAWRDASVSHTKNGIYGEMFVAAMIASAAYTNDTEKIIRSGLAQIPYTSRLYDDITKILEHYTGGKDKKECFKYIHSRYDECEMYGWCHTNSNAMIVAAALLYGDNDYGKSICTAVETGFDTDCNGATVGSIFGMANGISNIPEHWTAPFNNTLNTSIFGVGKTNISERAEMTLNHIEKMRTSK